MKLLSVIVYALMIISGFIVGWLPSLSWGDVGFCFIAVVLAYLAGAIRMIQICEKYKFND